MNHRRASKKLAVTVIPTLEAIPLNVPALPVATVAGQRGAGGFASTLAAAQGLPATSPVPIAASSSIATGAHGAGAGSTTALAANLNASSVAAPARKMSAGSSGAVSGNNVVPTAVAVTANLAQWLAPQTSVPPSATALTPANKTKTDVAEETVFAPLAAAATTAALSQPAGGTVGVTPVVAVSSGMYDQTSGGTSFSSELSSGFSAARAPSVPGANALNAAAGAQADRAEQSGFASELPTAGPTPPSVLSGKAQAASSLAMAQSSSSAISPNVTRDIPASVSQVSGIEGMATVAVPPASQTVEPTTPASMSGGGEASEGTSPVALLASSGVNLQMIQESVSDAGVAEPGAQSGLAEETAAGPLAAAGDAQYSAPAVLNPAPSYAATIAAALLERTATRVAAAKPSAEDGAPSVRGATPAAALSPASASSNGPGPTVADQTPFAVFFSDAGTESAASILPRMILPATSYAIHNNSSAPAGANPPSDGFSGNAVQNVAPLTTKDLLSGSQSSGSQAGTPLRRDAEPNSASLAGSSLPSQTSSAQTSSTQASSTPTAPTAALPSPVMPPVSAAAIPLLGAQAALADSSPKPETQPPVGGPASAVPPAAQVQPTPLPGPVQVAQMVSRVGQSEMRIGLNTSAFGSVEVRTVVRSSDVGLLIGSEKGDLRGLLTNEMPVLTNTLQQQNLRLNSVNFMQGFGFSNDASGGGGNFQQQQPFVPQPVPSSSPISSGSGLSEAAGNDSIGAQLAEEFAYAGGRISILA